MKKIAALLAALLLIPGAAGFAEGERYTRFLPRDEKYKVMPVSRESYPEIRITPHLSESRFFGDYEPADPLFLCIPLPEDALADTFDFNSAHLVDPVHSIQYNYQVNQSDSWEEFLNLADDDRHIILDGSDGLAAYIAPEEKTAYGMIAAKPFGKSAKLVISLTLDGAETDATPYALEQAIIGELERVRSAMVFEIYDPFWNWDDYDGVILRDEYDENYTLKVRFPKMEQIIGSGPAKKAGVIVTGIRWNRVSSIYDFLDGDYIQLQLRMEAGAYARSKIREGNPDAREITLDSGKTWDVYLHKAMDGEKINIAYADVRLDHTMPDGDPYYLTAEIQISGNASMSEEDLIRFLVLLDDFEVNPAEN